MAEILVVLIIIVLGSTIALYSYANYRKSLSVQTSARKLQVVLSQSRGRAINYNIPHDMVINLDKNTFWVDQFDASRTEKTPKVVAEEGLSEFVKIRQLQIGSNTYTNGTQTIPFGPDGTHPFIIIHLIREFDDPSVDANYFSVRMYPSSGEPQIVANDRL